MNVPHTRIVYKDQQIRILGENYSLEDEEDSTSGQVGSPHHVLKISFLDIANRFWRLWLANYTLLIFPLLLSAIVTAYGVDVRPVVCG